MIREAKVSLQEQLSNAPDNSLYIYNDGKDNTDTVNATELMDYMGDYANERCVVNTDGDFILMDDDGQVIDTFAWRA